MDETIASLRSTLVTLAIVLAGCGGEPQPSPVVPVVQTDSPPPPASEARHPAPPAEAPVTAATCESGWLDSRGSLRLEFELEGVAPGDEGRAVQRQVVRAFRARLGEVGIHGARVSWMNYRQVVVDIPPGIDPVLLQQARQRLQAPGLPVRLNFASESSVGPAVP